MSTYLEPIAEAIARGKRPEFSTGEIVDTAMSHNTTGDNYVWLWPYFGRVLWVDFREPAGKGEWQTYNLYFWSRHASLVSHRPETLVQDHVRFYIDSKEKQIDLKFFFQKPNGEVNAIPPTPFFYELEREWFERNGLGQGKGAHVYLEAEHEPKPFVEEQWEKQKLFELH